MNHARHSFLLQLLVLGQAEKVLEEVDWLITKLKRQGIPEPPSGKRSSGWVLRTDKNKVSQNLNGILLEVGALLLNFLLVGVMKEVKGIGKIMRT